MTQSLAIKYRPKTFNDVIEQGSIKIILNQQLESKTTKNAYLFCGGAGTGKTTCARIFADELNNHIGNTIEMDAASNNSVDDIRNIIQQAKTKSLDSEYKVFILDECHALSNSAWQALLKLLEEPPAKSVFIFCTTDPQKIPKTILSRVQRYDFQRISQSGIASRLVYILTEEQYSGRNIIYDMDAVSYIAKIADGGMRDAITIMDKCLAYSDELTVKHIIEAVGTVDYDTMFDLTDANIFADTSRIICIIEDVHKSGKDLKQFIKNYTDFVLDICKYRIFKTFEFINVPDTYEHRLKLYIDDYKDYNITDLLNTLIKLNYDIKWETYPKPMIESTLMVRLLGEK